MKQDQDLNLYLNQKEMDTNMTIKIPAATNQEGSPIDPGVYIVSLKQLEEVDQGENAKYPSATGTYLKWIFEITKVIDTDADDEDEMVGKELFASSSFAMGPRAKLRQFVEALLGRPLEVGESPEVDDLIGRQAKAIHGEVTAEDGSKAIRLKELLPHRPKKKKKSVSKPPPPPEPEDDEEEEGDDEEDDDDDDDEESDDPF